MSNSSSSVSRTVVLGAGGFVGRTLQTLLKSEQMPFIPIGSKEINLLTGESVSQLSSLLSQGDNVVFLSALTPDKGKDVATFQKNLDMVKNFVQAVKSSQKKLTQLIYVSSDAVYDDSTALVRESSPLHQSSLYGWMHLTREVLLKTEISAAVECLLILRPAAMYGTEDTHNSYGPNRYLRQALNENVISIFGQGEEVRDHLSVRDFSRVMVESLKNKISGTINVASGESVSFGEAAQKIANEVAQLKKHSVTIKNTERAPVSSYRRFDLTHFRENFSSFQFTPFSEGIRGCVHECTLR